MNKSRLMKRILSLLMALVLTLALIPVNMMTLNAEGADETEEPEITETITDDTPAAADDTYSEDTVSDDTGNFYEVIDDPGDHSVPDEQNVNDVPYTEPAAQAAEPVTVPAVEPAAEPVAETVAEPGSETVTEAAAESAAEEKTGPSDETVTEVPENLTDEVTLETTSEPTAEAAELTDESSEEEMTEPAEAVTFTVTFDANGHGTAPENITAEQDATISEPDALSEDGYIFTGWYKEAAAEELWDFSEDKVTEDITLYAGWTEDALTVMAESDVTFTVSFDANGHGTAPEAVIADEGELITEPDAPSEDGYTFTGWYKDAAAAEKWDFSADEVTEDITLYAGWLEEEPTVMRGESAAENAGTYTIEYLDYSDLYGIHPPDGDHITVNMPEKTTAVAGEVVHLAPIIPGPMPVKLPFGDDYVTYTWTWNWVVPRGSGNDAQNNLLDHSTGTFVMPESDVVVKGGWDYGVAIQLFTYHTNGGQVSHDGRNASWAVYSYATLTAVPDPGYYFVGWYHGDTKAPSGPIVSTQNPLRIQANYDNRYQRYWAVFAERAPGHITVIDGSADKTSAKEGTTVSITATMPSGNQVFDKWVAEPSTVQFADAYSAQTTFTMPAGDVTITATYVDTYTIHVATAPAGYEDLYTTGGGVYRRGETVTLKAFDNMSGYRFNGWWGFTGGAIMGYGKITDSDTYTFTAEDDRYLTAVYEKLPTVTVQESEGGTGSSDRPYVDAGQTVTLTATPNGGWRFDYWEVIAGDIVLDDPSSAETTFVPNGKDIVVKPHFYHMDVIVIVTPITVQESEGGMGTADPSYAANIGEEITLKAIPNGGWRFDYWEVIEGGVTLADQNSAETTFIFNGNAVVVKPHFYHMDVIITVVPVTYKVVNGTWSDGSTEDKTEYVLTGSSPNEVPTGMIAGEGFADGAWDVDPAGATITGATTFTYTFDAVQTYTVIYKVVNGTWADGTTTDKTETVAGGSSPASVPAGMIAAEGFTDGAWDIDPAGASITETTTFTYTFNEDSTKPDYTVTFDTNVPAGASTVCTGIMGDQVFETDEKKALSANGYSLPGYDFIGWNTEADGTGEAYSDGESVENLSDAGGIVTLYAQWNAKPYRIILNPGVIGGGEYVQTAYFDQPDTLDTYSDTAFGWNSGGRTLRGWVGTGFSTYYSDGAEFCNLCGEPGPDGSLSDRELVAEWIDPWQFVVNVTKDDVPQPGLIGSFMLTQGDAEFSVPIEYTKGCYVFNAYHATGPGIQFTGLPEGEYDLSFDAPGYPSASAHITYGSESGVSVTFAYYTVSLSKDSAYAGAHDIVITGGGPVEETSEQSVSVIALNGSELYINTIVDSDYRFVGYTVAGSAPEWEDGDPTKAEQIIRIQGKTAITAQLAPKPNSQLIITALPQTYTYNGQTQGEIDMVYEDPAEIAEKVKVEGLKDGDTLTSIVLDGQGQEVGTYDIIPSSATVNGDPASDRYDVIYVTGILTIIKAEYIFSAGAGITWTKGSSTGISYTINRNYEDEKTYSLFENIEVDGKVIAASNYTATAGSLNVTLNASYLNTLSNGSHTVKFSFKDGSAETELTIKPKSSSDTNITKPKTPDTPADPAAPADPGTSKVLYVPNTGDSSNLGLWTALLILSLMSLFGLLVYRREFTE